MAIAHVAAVSVPRPNTAYDLTPLNDDTPPCLLRRRRRPAPPWGDITARLRLSLARGPMADLETEASNQEANAFRALVLHRKPDGTVPRATKVVSEALTISLRQARKIVQALRGKGLVWRPKAKVGRSHTVVVCELGNETVIRAKRPLFRPEGSPEVSSWDHSETIALALARVRDSVLDLDPDLIPDPDSTNRRRVRRLVEISITGGRGRRSNKENAYMLEVIKGGKKEEEKDPRRVERTAKGQVPWAKLIADHKLLPPKPRGVVQKVSSGGLAEMNWKAQTLTTMFEERAKQIDPNWVAYPTLRALAWQTVRAMEEEGLRSPEEWPGYLDWLFKRVSWKGPVIPAFRSTGYHGNISQYMWSSQGHTFKPDWEKIGRLLKEKFPFVDHHTVMTGALMKLRGHSGEPEFPDYSQEPGYDPAYDYVAPPPAVQQQTRDAIEWLSENMKQIGYRRVALEG